MDALRLIARGRACCLGLALLVCSASGQTLPDDRLESVADAMAAVRAARESGIEVTEARVKLDVALIELEADGIELLARPLDLGRALALAERAALPKGRKAPRGGKVETLRIDDGSFGAALVQGAKEGGFELALRAPKADDVPRPGWPLIVSLVPPGEDPAAHLRSNWTSRAGLADFAVVAPQLPADEEAWPRVARDGRPGGVAHVLASVRAVRGRLAIDPDRIFVVAKDTAAVAALAAADQGPERFAGVVLKSAAQHDIAATNFRHVPTLWVGGGQPARDFEAAIRAAGHQDCELVDQADEDALLRWMRERQRSALPTNPSFYVGKPFPTRSHWLRVQPNSNDTGAEAEVDRKLNRIRLTVHGASAITLHLSDALVDLDSIVLVELDGEVHEARVRRSVATLVDRWLEGTSDPSAPYVADVVVVPGVGVLDDGLQPARVDAEFDERLAAAMEAAVDGGAAAPLWELSIWCRATGREDRAREVLLKALRIEPHHRPTREALGHVRAPMESIEEWFTSERDRARWMRYQGPAFGRALGHVERDGRWMHSDDRDLWARGWAQDAETGLWTTREDERRLKSGWARQDHRWLEPLEAARADQDSWLVDGEWLSAEAANRRRASIASAWRIPRWHVDLRTTCDREVALRAATAMENALPALRRVFGVEPRLPLRVAMMRNEEQYDRLAFGAPDGRRPATHLGRMQGVHSAYFAESWFGALDGERAFLGGGVGYWDAESPNGDAYGYHAARLAFGLSFVDALDPSPKAMQRALSRGVDAEYPARYEDEKSLPRWLRIGGPVYAERYYEDVAARERGGDAWWARKWSLENLEAQGGLSPIDEVLAAVLDPDERFAALRRMLECGLVVAFVVDGGCEPVEKAHAALVAGLRAGRVKSTDVAALEAALREHEGALRAFVTASQ